MMQIGNGDEPNKHIITTPPIEIPEFKGLGAVYFEKMLKNKDKSAYTIALTGEKFTYGVILEKSIRAAFTMRAKGIKAHDVISICSYNIVDSFIAYYGGLFIGAISANFDPELPVAATAQLLEQVRPKMVFAIPEGVQLMENALKEANIDATIVVFGDTQDYLQFSDFLLPSPKEEAGFTCYEVENVKETAAILFSSGSSGLPKGICLTHYGIYGNAYSAGDAPEGIVQMTFSNLYWISTTTVTAVSVLNCANRIMHPKSDVTKVWELIKQYKVQLMFLTAYQLIDMCKNGILDGADTSSLGLLLLGGGPITEAHFKLARDCLPQTKVANTYGQTEINGRSLCFQFNEMDLALRKSNSVGRPLRGFTYKIVDPVTEEILGANQEGELRIKSELQMNGFYNQEAVDVWDSEGFLKTGDIAYYDEDQCFFIVDRIKELLKYKMWHISPLMLDNILGTHPAIYAAMVVGLPHEIDGDHPLAVVVLKKSAVGKVTEEEIRMFVDDQVGNQFKLRGGVKFVDKLPVTVNEKFSRKILTNMIINGEI